MGTGTDYPTMHLPIRGSSPAKPHSDGGQRNEGEVGKRRFLEARSDGAVGLEAVEAAFNLVAVFIDFFVVRDKHFSILFARNHGLRPGPGNLVAHVVRVVRPVGQHVLAGAQVGSEQVGGLRAVAGLAPGQGHLPGPAQRVAAQVQRGREAAPAAAERLRAFFFSAPAACWWARTMVESTWSWPNPVSSCKAARALAHTPLCFQREKRTKTRCQGPNRSGRSRHGTPQRRRQRMASTNKRVSRAVTPGLCAWPGSKGDNRAHCASVNNMRSAFMPKTTPD